MAYLRHDSGGEAVLKNRQILGSESPLEFDEDGYAGPVDDEDAEMVAAMNAHVEVVGAPLDQEADGDEAADAEESEEPSDFDAAAFVDRTPMSEVVEDIESGDYDEHLDAIETEAERQGVQDAINERRG